MFVSPQIKCNAFLVFRISRQLNFSKFQLPKKILIPPQLPVQFSHPSPAPVAHSSTIRVCQTGRVRIMDVIECGTECIL
jgi:hypothetical protein